MAVLVALVTCCSQAREAIDLKKACVDAAEEFFEEGQSIFSQSTNPVSYFGKWNSFGRWFNQIWEAVESENEFIILKMAKSQGTVKHLGKKPQKIDVLFPEKNDSHIHYLNPSEMGQCKLFKVNSEQPISNYGLICVSAPPMENIEESERFVCYARPPQNA